MLNGNNDAYLIPTTSAADFGGAGVLLHYHHHPHHNHHHHHPDQVFPSLYLSAPLENTNVYSSQDNGGLNGEASSAVRKPTAKKDRHRKIYTSQGPRDRRVRLSIGIARKFFDLQEMLVFDKPSKTLDWLLTKSKAAIKELVQTKQNGAVCSSKISISSPSECDSKWKGKGDAAKEMRAKARARARERTLEKMCKKHLGGCETQNVNGSSSNSVKMNGGYCNEAATRDLIQDSIMIKKKSKNPNPTLGFQQNHVFSRDLNSNFLIPSAYQNWDVSGFWDQHKFINNNSNM